MPTAATFATPGDSPTGVVRGLTQTLQTVARPAGAMLFVSGALGERLPALAAALADAQLGVPVLVAAGAGVLTERGEIEGQSAACGLVWSGGRAAAFSVSGQSADELGLALARAVTAHSEPRTAATAIVFARPNGVSPHVLDPLGDLGDISLFGAGTVGDPGVIAVDAKSRTLDGGAAGLVLHGITRPLIGASPACRLLMPLRTITETRGQMVLEIEGERALDVLSSVAKDLTDQPLVFVVLSSERSEGLAMSRRELLVRAVQGVDPVRRGLVISHEVQPGMRMAFAVRDGATARQDLEAVVRDLARETAGAAPRFGVYLNCAGRGSSLYGTPDVDIRILRARLGELPIIGMQSSFEIAPVLGRPRLQLYTGVLGLFTAPS